VREKGQNLFFRIIRQGREHPLDQIRPLGGNPYAYAQPRKVVVSQKALDRPQSLVPAIASAGAKANLTHIEGHIVDHNQEVCGDIDSLSFQPRPHWRAASVHIHDGLEEDHPFVAARSLGDKTPPFPPEAPEAPVMANPIDYPPSHIVSGRIVLGARIPQPCNDLHEEATMPLPSSRRSARALQ